MCIGKATAVPVAQPGYMYTWLHVHLATCTSGSIVYMLACLSYCCMAVLSARCMHAYTHAYMHIEEATGVVSQAPEQSKANGKPAAEP
jgi:hypothetical protein